MKDLRGRHAVVTGASRGLGVVIADRLATEGANLTLVARSAGELEATRAAVETRGVRAVAVPADVTDASDRERLVTTAIDALGPIDVLVNNAGVENLGWFTDLADGDIERTIAVNLTAALLLTRRVLPSMLERGAGHVVNVASTAGKGGAPFEVVYCATKAGLVRATEALRSELSGTGVSVSTVCPGFVEREGMYARHVAETGTRASRWIGTTTPENVADAVVRAIRTDAPEIIVNSTPLRPLLALAEAVPRLRRPVTNWLVYPLLRRAADFERERERG